MDATVRSHIANLIVQETSKDVMQIMRKTENAYQRELLLNELYVVTTKNLYDALSNNLSELGTTSSELKDFIKMYVRLAITETQNSANGVRNLHIMEKDFNLKDLLMTISEANNMFVSIKGTWESVEKNKITFDCDSENGGAFNGQFFIYNLDRQNGILSLYISDMGLSIERVFRINIMDEQTFVLTDSRGHRETFFKRG